MGVFILFWIIGTVLVSLWASKWKHSWILFSAISIILTPLIAGLILVTWGHRKGICKCPKCGKWREISDTKCIHCEHESTEDEINLLANADKKRSSIRKVRLVILAIFLVIPFWTIYEITQSFFPPMDEIIWEGFQDGIGFETLQHGKIESGEYIVTAKISNHLGRNISALFITCRLRTGYKKWSYFRSSENILENMSVGLPANRSIEYTF